MRVKLLACAMATGLAMALGKTLAGSGIDVQHIEANPDYHRIPLGPRKSRPKITAAQLKRDAKRRRNIERHKPKN